ncbi:MAG: thiamine pyrophosphate-dependent enzyme, partial [Oscillospiraceae bacterium]|nr:thiamine pyrophosphate-dependent enzyme [Oscillospiraceae bacterium]
SHCDRLRTVGVDMTTGSLGQGASSAVGIALGQKLKGWDARTFLILGDGELNEGQVWEALSLAAFKKLDNLIIFCDKNGRQLDGATADVLDMGDLAAKFTAFGLYTQTIDGHDTGTITRAIGNAKGRAEPCLIILNTVKGNTTFVADMEANHHVAFTPEQIAGAIENTKARLAQAKEASQ